MKNSISIFVIFAIVLSVAFGHVFSQKIQRTQNNEYLERQILQELEEINENLRDIKELEGRIIDKLR